MDTHPLPAGVPVDLEQLAGELAEHLDRPVAVSVIGDVDDPDRALLLHDNDTGDAVQVDPRTVARVVEQHTPRPAPATVDLDEAGPDPHELADRLEGTSTVAQLRAALVEHYRAQPTRGRGRG